VFPVAFDYRRPASIDEAVSMLRDYGGEARILAGGQSLIPAMRYRLARPAALIDINPLSDLAYVREVDGVLAVGALARDAMLERMPLITRSYPMIADVSMVVADPVVRQMGTVVGSLCHNDPAGDWSVAALAARAQVAIRSATGTRVVPIDDFLVDSFTTAVADGEMAVEVRFPSPPARTSGAYQKIERKVGDFATSSAAVQITLENDGTIAQAGVAIGAAGPKALRVADAELMLRGAKPTRELIRAAGDAAVKVADPAADTRGTVPFKKAMAGVLVARALTTACERLGIGGLR
jgi:aerobic carbon-monoxide dehydrogenase medium subunit